MKMKRKRSLVVAFLLVLYIVPMLFISSYVSPTILTEPNTAKDFSIASVWYDAEWVYRKSVLILQASGIAGYNYTVQIPVTYDLDMQTDFDDIRFTDDDGETLLDHWRESYIASTSAVFWVEVQDYIDENADTTVYMYYGNSVVSSVSNGTNTFIFFDDFEDNDLDEWDTATGSITTGIVHTGTYAAEMGSGESLQIVDGLNLTSGVLFHWQLYAVSSFKGGTLNMWSSGDDYGAYIRLYETDTSPVYYYDGAYKQFSGSTDIYNGGTWYEYELGVDQDYGGGDPDMRLFMEGAYIGEEDFHEADDTDFETEDIDGFGIASQAAYTNYVDDVWVRKWAVSEPAFDSFGDEEGQETYPRWRVVGIAELIFTVPVFTGSLDALIILLGLILIPASTLFLVYSSKHNMSSEKVFLFLIMFVMGWALFLGGIMP